MKVLVTGGTGFVGKEVLRQLHAAGHDIRLVARDSQSADAREAAQKFRAQTTQGNILDASSLKAAFDGVDAVIHLVGIISEVGENTFERIHGHGTENVVNAAKLAGVRRFVHMSALGTRPDAVARYHKSKWAGEGHVRSSGLDGTIFRPSIIYGFGDQFVNLFVKMSRFSPVLPVMGSGRGTFQPVPVSDVAKCFVRALEEPQAVGKCLDVCGPDVLALREVLQTILKVTDRRRLIIRIPLPLAKMQAVFLEFAYGRVLKKAPPLNRDQLIMLEEETIGDPKPANELFGITPPPFGEGIAQYRKG